ncbi:hypothetical protein [Mesorhizobium sp.]|uniref:hypothetical protein n=1 Tax=Mesorhizobium sp. TaxID=1871066 RepID=UPI0011F41947|nr:hypothetical protein [Mesorhizobium sp.]TIL50517.1 MAG: hypothetical protein E5Y83_21030 [Mesorhizobium sp.]
MTTQLSGGCLVICLVMPFLLNNASEFVAALQHNFLVSGRWSWPRRSIRKYPDFLSLLGRVIVGGFRL